MAIDTYFQIGDTHGGGVPITLDGNGFMTDPNIRQIEAINSMAGKVHPLGGIIDHPLVVFQVGDFKHEDLGGVDPIASYYRYDGQGRVSYKCRRLRGNHDQNDVANLILANEGSLTWGEKIGKVWFQAMTEDYTAPFSTLPPGEAQISGVVAASVHARPQQELVFFMCHRAMSGSYETEWTAAGTTALENLMLSRRTLGLLHGHDHYAQHYNWRGYRAYSPGSVAQSPLDGPPFTTTYPESFSVIRVSDDYYDIANYIFGYDETRTWVPGTWKWTERVNFARFWGIAAANLGTARFSPHIPMRLSRSRMAKAVIVRGRADALVGGGSVELRASLVSSGIRPTLGSVAGNVLAGKRTWNGTDAEFVTIFTGAGTGDFSAIFQLGSAGNNSGRLGRVPGGIALRVSNPGAAYTAGNVLIDEIELVP